MAAVVQASAHPETRRSARARSRRRSPDRSTCGTHEPLDLELRADRIAVEHVHDGIAPPRLSRVTRRGGRRTPCDRPNPPRGCLPGSHRGRRSFRALRQELLGRNQGGRDERERARLQSLRNHCRILPRNRSTRIITSEGRRRRARRRAGRHGTSTSACRYRTKREPGRDVEHGSGSAALCAARQRRGVDRGVEAKQRVAAGPTRHTASGRRRSQRCGVRHRARSKA